MEQQSNSRAFVMYYQLFTKADIAARHGESSQQLMELYTKSLRKPADGPEKTFLAKAMARVDQITSACSLLRRIPWNVMVQTDPKVEGDLPHTHGQVIVLPPSYLSSAATTEAKCIRTLLHEKIHIYQRTFPAVCNSLYTDFWQFSILGHVASDPWRALPRRSNPDINTLVYADEFGKPILGLYATPDEPELTKITDARDHPHEMMAYLVCAILLGEQPPPHLMKYSGATREWMNKYLCRGGA